MSTPDPFATAPDQDPAGPALADPASPAPSSTDLTQTIGASPTDSVYRTPIEPDVPDDYGTPEPPDRGGQHAFDAPPAAPPENEAYPWPVADDFGGADRSMPPPPPPVGWQPDVPPYAGGQPSPTSYESPTPMPYPAAGSPPPPRPSGYGPPSGGYSPPTAAYAPYGYVAIDPFAKSRTVAGILGILLGGLGLHRFYLGYVGIGVLQIVVTFLTFGTGAIWGLVEGILYLTQRTGQFSVDATGRPLRE